MNSVLDWHFYEMHTTYLEHTEWWLRDSNDSQPVYCPGDKHFNPPKGGMLAFDHANPAVRSWWESVCLKAVASGVVDGCFSDSSQPDTHGTGRWLNASYHDKFEQGKVDTMAALTTKFGEPSCRRRCCCSAPLPSFPAVPTPLTTNMAPLPQVARRGSPTARARAC